MSYMFLFWIVLINRNCGDSIITFGFYYIQFVINYLQTTKICALTRIFNLNSFLLLKFYSHNHHSFFIMTSPGWIRTSENAGVKVLCLTAWRLGYIKQDTFIILLIYQLIYLSHCGENGNRTHTI